MHHISIPQNPNVGDTICSLLLGHKSEHTMILQPCPKCGEKRWVCNTKSERVRECRSCYIKNKAVSLRPYRRVKTISIYDIPKEGDVIIGRDINRKKGLYQWAICPDCKRGRWVSRGAIPLSAKCVECGNKTKKTYIGEKNVNWNGGRLSNRKGYVWVIVRKDNPYYSMANRHGYIPEHRLVMAQHLGRAIEKWEIVHHKNGIKSDNRIENLELIESKNAHNIITVMQTEIQRLQKYIGQLEVKIKMNEWRIKELERDLVFRKS